MPLAYRLEFLTRGTAGVQRLMRFLHGADEAAHDGLAPAVLAFALAPVAVV